MGDRSHPAFAHTPPWVFAKLRPQAKDIIVRVYNWVETECIPADRIMKAQLAKPDDRWRMPPLMASLREKAKAAGLFNLFLPPHFAQSPGLTNLEYSVCAELMGRCYWAAQTMNCHAPETGNIELLAKYASEEQKEKWLKPLLEGTAASGYSMTEPDVASSDATSIRCQIDIGVDGDDDMVEINGRKLFGNSQMNKHMSFYILMGCSDPDNPDRWRRHSMVIVPARTKGLTLRRNLTIMGYDHAPDGHGEYVYDRVRVPRENIILGPGRAFEIAQGRLGPGRIHHCMRLIGQAERAYALALSRCVDKRKMPRGKRIGDFDSNIERIALMRMRIDGFRQIVSNAADTIDILGPKAGKYVIAQAKVLVPAGVAKIIDECMQIWGGQGLTQHSTLPEMWTYARFVRLADGPDSSHAHQVGRDQIRTAAVESADREEEYERRYQDLCVKWKTEREIF